MANSCRDGLASKESWVSAKRLLKLLTHGCSTVNDTLPTVVRDGALTNSVDDVLHVFSTHYQTEMNPVPNTPFCEATDRLVSDTLNAWRQGEPETVESMDAEFCLQELTQALRSMHNWKAADHDDLISELMKAGGPTLHTSMLRIINFCWMQETIPESWTYGTIVSLFKSGSPEDPSNYRGITLLSVFRKLFCTMLKNRLQNNVELHESQAAFRSHRGCVDHIYTFAEIVREVCRTNDRRLYAFFLDIRKAYDTVWRDGLLYKLLQKGVRGRLGRVIAVLLSNTRSQVRFQDTKSEYFPITLGVGQGDPLSTILFDIFIDDLLSELHNRPKEHCIPLPGNEVDRIAALTFADDVNAMSASRAGLQGHINAIDGWLFKWRSLPSLSKSKVMIFNKHQDDEVSEFRMRGRVLEQVSLYKYLGVWFQGDGSWAAQTEHVRAQMNKALGKWRPVLRCHHLPVVARLRVVQALVYTPALYGAEVWTPMKTDLDKLDTICLRAIRSVFGLHQFDCHEEILFADSGIPPISLLMKASKLCWRHKMTNMTTDRFPIAVQGFKPGGEPRLGRPSGIGFREAVLHICRDINTHARINIKEHAPDGHESHKHLRAKKLRRSCRLDRGQRRTLAEGNLTFTYAQLTRGIVLYSLWIAYLENKLELRSRNDKITAVWMRRMIGPNVGCAAGYLTAVDRGLARVLLSARSYLLPFLCLPRNLKYFDRSLAAGAFTEYIQRAPIRSVLPADPVAHGIGPLSGSLLEVVAQLLSFQSLYRACGLTWSDVAVVLLVGMDGSGGDIGVPGVALRPLPLSEMARVIAFCGVCRSLQRFVAWLPPSVPVPGVVNVLEDKAV